jgi:hypothetical protein
VPASTASRALWNGFYEAALSPSTPGHLIYRLTASGATVELKRPLPAEFLEALEGHDEVLVTSREGTTRGTVPVWFIVEPPGVVYLFGFAFSEKARRWRSDPWVRLTVPGTRVSAEGVVHFIAADELDDVGEHVVERWSMQGATTLQGLKRTLRDQVHVLVRIEGV